MSAAAVWMKTPRVWCSVSRPRTLKPESQAQCSVRLEEDEVVRRACEILARRMESRNGRYSLKDPDAVRRFLQLRYAEFEHEVFSAVWLDNQHRVMKFEELSAGTIDGASVYPREVVKAALAANAAAVIFAHNHPSGVAEPSAADRALTERLKSALAQIDIRVLDHFVVGAQVVSFAERGWI